MRRTYRAPSRDRAELEHAFERRVVISDEEARTLVRESARILGGDLGEEVDVFVCVETRHGLRGCAFGTLEVSARETSWPSVLCPSVRVRGEGGETYEDVHLGQHVVCGYEFVGDAHALWFHGVGDTVGVCADVGWGWTSEVGKGK